jgi:UDP-perosamine 4-acetyltransferase
MRRCVVVGGGGHAKVVIDAMRTLKELEPVAVTDPRGELQDVLGVPVVGGDDRLAPLHKRGVRWFVVGLGSVADNRPRARLYEVATGRRLKGATVRHAAATVAGSASLGDGTVVLAQAAVNADARIGANCIVNTGAIVEHDCGIGDHVHVCPGAVIGGGARIGTGAFVGSGAVVKQGVSVGRWAVIGAGAVVLQDVGEGATVAGIPARRLGRSR